MSNQQRRPATFGPCQVAGTQFTSSTQELLLNQIRPFRGYGPVRLLQTRFNSNYHSLQITAQRRFSRNSQINLAYTWAKNLTNSQNEFCDRAAEYLSSSTTNTRAPIWIGVTS